jgi:hypothetical protein
MGSARSLTNGPCRVQSGVVRARKFGRILFTGFESNHENAIGSTAVDRILWKRKVMRTENRIWAERGVGGGKMGFGGEFFLV